MFGAIEVEKAEYQLKPMNCPGHILIFKSKLRSYRELPVRLAELGTVYRYERSGVLHGLLRVRGLTQDDAHLFVREEQIEAEVAGCVRFGLDLFKLFGFSDLELHLATRPEKFMGEPAAWERADAAAAEGTAALAAAGLRADSAASADKLGAKVRRAQLEKIPTMLVVGEKDLAARVVSPRMRDGQQLPATPLDDMVRRLVTEAA